MNDKEIITNGKSKIGVTEISNKYVYAALTVGHGGFRFEKTISSLTIPISLEERNRLAALWAAYKNTDVWDEGAIRLESIELGNVCMISEISFYDLLVTNIIREDYIGFRRFAETMGEYEAEVLDKMKEIYIGIAPESFQNILDSPLSNAIGISLMLYSSEGDLLLVRRSEDVAIGQNLLSVAVTASINHNDYQELNPVISAIMRETREELGIELNPDRIHIDGLAAGKRKLQPAFLASAIVDGNFDNLLAVRPSCEEISKVLKISDGLFDVSNEKMTEIAKYQLMNDARIIK